MHINDNIISVMSVLPEDLLMSVASRVKLRRLELQLTQQHLAAKAGIPLPTYRRFERSGEIALRSLIMLAFALDATDDFHTLFASQKYRTMDDLLSAKQPTRKRGKRNGSN